MKAALSAGLRQADGTREALSRRGAFVWAGLATLLALVFLALGIWQVERRAWKLDLIARVDARLAAPAATAPNRAEWPLVTREADEYRRVRAEGRWLADRSVRVMAVTERGSGFWLLTPLQTASGEVILVNRGFVPSDWTAPMQGKDNAASVTGLLRLSEPGGGFLRSNDPAGDRWFSRDTEAIATARGLGPTAPFFIDADSAANGPGGPVGGLTVVAFRNSHLTYALTWFALAAIAGSAVVLLLRGIKGGAAR